ncbi:MAG: hypothetical protein R6U63_08220 [Longimicrobiales bacterium]
MKGPGRCFASQDYALTAGSGFKYVTGRRILEGVETRAELERELQAEGMTIETFMLNPFFDEFVQEWPWLKELKIADDES